MDEAILDTDILSEVLKRNEKKQDGLDRLVSATPMIRAEYLIAGCILVVAGLGMCIVGYNGSQPTQFEQAVGVIEQLSGSESPHHIKPARIDRYMLSGAGIVLFCCGVILILRSRATPSPHATTQWRDASKRGRLTGRARK